MYHHLHFDKGFTDAPLRMDHCRSGWPKRSKQPWLWLKITSKWYWTSALQALDFTSIHRKLASSSFINVSIYLRPENMVLHDPDFNHRKINGRLTVIIIPSILLDFVFEICSHWIFIYWDFKSFCQNGFLIYAFFFVFNRPRKLSGIQYTVYCSRALLCLRTVSRFGSNFDHKTVNIPEIWISENDFVNSLPKQININFFIHWEFGDIHYIYFTCL